MTKQLSVRLNGIEVGILSLVNGKMKFVYNENATQPISLSLPIQKEPFKEKLCRSFFGGLLPNNGDGGSPLGFAPRSQSFALVASPQYAQSVYYPDFTMFIRPQIRSNQRDKAKPCAGSQFSTSNTIKEHIIRYALLWWWEQSTQQQALFTFPDNIIFTGILQVFIVKFVKLCSYNTVLSTNFAKLP